MNFVAVNDTHFMLKSGTRLEVLPALLEKWAWVLEFASVNNAVLLHTGDFFNTPVVPDEVKAQVCELIMQHKVRVFGIYGNHDMMYNNHEFSGRTSLNLLELSGFITIVRSELDFGGVSVAPLGVPTSQPAVVLGHAFLDTGYAPVVSSASLDVYSKPTCIFLGHDHSTHPPLVVNVQVPTVAYRFGSFIRQTVDCQYDTPSVALVSFVDGKFDVKIEPIAVAKPAVFISQSTHSINIGEEEMGNLVSSLSSISMEVKDLNFYLSQVSTPEVLSYISTL